MNIIRRDYVLNFTLAAEWIHYCVRVHPMVSTLLHVLLSWLKNSQTDMDEEVFIHFVLFYLVHRRHIPSLEYVMEGRKKGEVIIPAPDETTFFGNGPTAPRMTIFYEAFLWLSFLIFGKIFSTKNIPPKIFDRKLLAESFVTIILNFILFIYLVSILAADFFKFMQTFDVENLYLNTFNGEIGKKDEAEEPLWQHNIGLTILHPFYDHILLLPTD